MKRSRLIVVGPLPPPVHGVTVSTSLVLANQPLAARFDVEHLDTSDHRSGKNVGRWDVRNAISAVRAVLQMARRARGRRGVVYLPVSQSTPGFLRDSLLILVAHALGWRVAVHLRGSDFRSYYEASPRFLRQWILLVLARIDSVAVMGESLRWVFRGLVASERIAIVPNGTPEPEHVDVLRDPQHVLFLSNLRRRKGVVEAVEAALLVLQQFPSARFTFAGTWESNELETELRMLARSAGAAIEFRKAVDGEEKSRLIASAAILLFPPVEPEGHPRVVLEALAGGLPVVTTDRGAIRETVVDGETGYVLQDPEPPLLADRMLTLLRDNALRERMCNSARASYREQFTQEIADRNLMSWLLLVSQSGGLSR